MFYFDISLLNFWSGKHFKKYFELLTLKISFNTFNTTKNNFRNKDFVINLFLVLS